MVEHGLFLRPTESAFEQSIARESFTKGKSYPVVSNDGENDRIIIDDVGDSWSFLNDKVKIGMFEVLSPEDIIEETLEKTEGDIVLNRAILNLIDAMDKLFDATTVDLATVLINLEIR